MDDDQDVSIRTRGAEGTPFPRTAAVVQAPMIHARAIQAVQEFQVLMASIAGRISDWDF